jgi:hypothetical protein
MNQESKTFLMPLAIVIGALIIGGTLLFLKQEKTEEPARSEETLSPGQIANTAIDYINQNLLQEGVQASLIEVLEENGVYKVRLEIEGQEYDSYITKDGKLLFPQGISLTTGATEEGTSSQSQDIPKSDKPNVKLFVMSYCSYGLQAQKMFLPVYDLLKEKAEMGIYFVNYIMHDKEEIDENLKQYCIQKEEKEKYDSYLNCFVKDGNFEECLSLAEIDKTLLTACIASTDQEYSISSQYEDKSTWLNGNFPKFDVHTELNEQYGVRGSPTVVINNQVVNVNPRSPENFKDIICQAFNSLPQECSEVLSDDVPSPGFGLGTTSNSGGACE